MAKKKNYVWFWSHNKDKPTNRSYEQPFYSEKDALKDALSELERNEIVSIFKAEVKKVNTYKQKLVKQG